MTQNYHYRAIIFFLLLTLYQHADPFTAWSAWNMNNVNVVSYAIRTILSPPQASDNTLLPNYSFNDLAGSPCDEIKETVDIINNSQKYSRLGIELPKGILLHGPSGNGKTAIARAIAGETKSAFFPASGIDFIELYAGVGSKRIRDLFNNARQAVQSGNYTKAIIFIDEIDAIGNSRQSSSNYEYRNTLNELINQMDGFFQDSSLIVIAATNRLEDLDKALLRPGRFNKLIEITPPNLANRQAIIMFHAKKLNSNVPEKLFFALAKKTEGFSGAELKSLIKEAALIAARENAPILQEEHFAQALKTTLVQKKNR